MTAYATVDELAEALRIRATAENTPVLESCLESAATEIDAFVDRVDGLTIPDPVPDIVQRTNINRAVEWWKAPDAANGGVGFDQIGTVELPTSGFGRHAAAILSLKEQWGIG